MTAFMVTRAKGETEKITSAANVIGRSLCHDFISMIEEGIIAAFIIYQLLQY